ncbi:hypothetical protein B5M09_000805 [Aphanomyces astaci]|uniref:Uncharacterized protein n=1 Tax=Aphanomyces astaci TaxID=112090 RepID=A0A3R7WHT8_APHAT|nr:hypothetical protein B5M09_000805 [Aphanomyces astaci]
MPGFQIHIARFDVEPADDIHPCINDAPFAAGGGSPLSAHPRASLVPKPARRNSGFVTSEDYMTWFEYMEAVCGFLYVAASIASGVVYLQVLYPSFANELTWPYFNTSTHLFIGDLCNLGLPTQYCWVDFDKTFEMAHTAARQARCASMYHANAAVHYEAMLRNIPWAKWETSFGGPNGSFTRAIAV